MYAVKELARGRGAANAGNHHRAESREKLAESLTDFSGVGLMDRAQRLSAFLNKSD